MGIVVIPWGYTMRNPAKDKMPWPPPSGPEPIGERQARILHFLQKERHKNEIDRYCTGEKISSRMTTFELLESFEEQHWVIKEKKGRQLVYRLSDHGTEELKRFMAFREGKLTDLVPIGPVEIFSKYAGKDGTGGLLAEEMRKKFNELFSDPKRAEELLRVFYSISTAYAFGLQGEDINSNYGGFTSDGRFVHATLYGRKESLELRELFNSGHFEKEKEGAHIADLLSVIGLYGLESQFQGHQRENFISHALASFFVLATDEEKIFAHHPSQLDKETLARIKKSFITNIESIEQNMERIGQEVEHARIKAAAKVAPKVEPSDAA